MTASYREKIFTIAGPEFGSDCDKIFIIIRALCDLKRSGAVFRSFLANHLHDIGCRPSQADPDLWTRAAIKSNGVKYWEYILCYINGILCISHGPIKSMKLTQLKFKIKENRIKPLTTYLSATISTMNNAHGNQCWTMFSDQYWTMFSDQYCAALVTNAENELQKKSLRLPSKCVAPLSNG